MLCRKSERGDLFCGEALEYVDGNCTGSNCTAGCSNSLRQAGCCVNDETSYHSRHLTTCNIQQPPPCKRSNLQIPNIVRDHSCTFNDYFSASCDNIRPVFAILASEEACSDEAEKQRDLCSSRYGEYCQVEFLNSMSTGLQAIMKSGTDCPSVSNCSLQCHASLNLVKSTIGCCFHSLSVIDHPQSSVYQCLKDVVASL